MEAITMVLILAMMIEAVVQVFKGWVPETANVPKWLWPAASTALGVTLCLLAQVDLLTILGVELMTPLVGQVLTGVIISRGASFVHDLWQNIKDPTYVNRTSVYYDHLPDDQEQQDNG